MLKDIPVAFGEDIGFSRSYFKTSTADLWTFRITQTLSEEATPTPPRLVQVEPMKLAKKPWGFTSAPLMRRPNHAPAAPAPPPPPAEPAAVPRLPGRAGFLSSPLCIVPPKPRVLVRPEGPPPPPEESDLGFGEVYLGVLQVMFLEVFICFPMFSHYTYMYKHVKPHLGMTFVIFWCLS